MATAISDAPTNLLDELDRINEIIDVIAPCMHEEELWNIDECLCKLEAFFRVLPAEAQRKVLNSSGYSFVVSDLMTD